MKENSIENLQNKKYFNNIDEAIKVYEEFRRFKNDGFIESIDTDFLFNLTDNILSDYKRVLKENEHKTEKIENQKSELAILNNKQKDFNKLQNTLKSYEGQFRRQEKEINKLKNKLLDILYGQKVIKEETPQYIKENYIPIQKIKNKIKILEKLQNEFLNNEELRVKIIVYKN